MKLAPPALVSLTLLVAVASACAESAPAGAPTRASAPAPMLGVCAHVTRDEFAERDKTFHAARRAGITHVRTDFDWRAVQAKPGAKFDFSRYDRVVADAARSGLRILPILGQPPSWATPVQEHVGEWRDFVRAFAKRYRGKIDAVEIWNEENHEPFWHNPDPEAYAGVLAAAHTEIKAAAPEMRVVLGGLFGIPWDWIDRLYELGAQAHFDVLAVHPYVWPNAPDDWLPGALARLRAAMDAHGDAGKPIWITEIGWPTPAPRVPCADLLLAGLRVARPERASWRVAYADSQDEPARGRLVAAELAKILPKRSSAVWLPSDELARRLDAGKFDAVVYPYNESFPVRTLDAVARFVERGGVLVDFGGYPGYFGYDGASVVGKDAEGRFPRDELTRRLRIDVVFPSASNGLSADARAAYTQAALDAGHPADLAGFRAFRFFGTGRLAPGDELVPLATVRAADGREGAAACVVRFGSDMAGALVLAGGGGDLGGTTEREQAAYLLRTLDIAAEAGVEAVFLYELRAPEKNPHSSEDHYGIVHADFKPKAAWRALAERAASMRPPAR